MQTYRANRAFLHGGRQVQRGDLLDLEGVPAGRVQSMVRLRIVEPAEPQDADPSGMTKAELTDALTDAGVDVPATARKAELVALYEEKIN